jgi:hypothetical protein
VLSVWQGLFLTFWLAAEAAGGGGEVRGRVADETGAPIPGVPVVLTLQSGAMTTADTDMNGEFVFPLVPDGPHQLVAQLVNFSGGRREVVVLDADVRADLVLRPSLSAHVVVTAPRTFRNVAEIPNPEESLVGLATSASLGAVTARQLRARPALRAAEVLEAVPGMTVTQHSGEGKASQYYLRGFNLDHGTDFATSVAGVPVNMPTHAHGHGYSDLSFLIPELVSGVQYRKGPYFADQGDFSAAGAANISYVSRLDRPLLETSAGGFGWRRVLLAASRRLAEGDLLFAGEATVLNGPWERPDDYERLNGVLRFSRGNARQAASVTLVAYRGRWFATDQVPERALASGLVGRFGTLDPSDGGESHRYSLSADVQRGSATASTQGSAYVLAYGLDLFSNFTYFLDDPENGDQFEQRDRRVVAGGRVLHRRLGSWIGRQVEHAFGAELRHDAIGDVGLYRTKARARRSVVREDAVAQTSAGVFLQSEIAWAPHLKTIAGLRTDVFDFDVDADTSGNSGRRTAAIVSPKLSVIAGPWAATEIYVNAGRGFHSNDARGTTITVDPATGERVDPVTPLASAAGAEIGLRSVLIPRTQVTFALWTLGVASELVFVGDAGTTTAGRPSRRSGVELSAYTALVPHIHADVDLALSRARFTDEDASGHRIPGAAGLVASAGLSLESWRRLDAGLRWRYLGARPLVEDGSVRSAPTGLLNARLGYAVTRQLRLGVEGFNLLSAGVSDVDYFYVSRLPGEPLEGVADRHTHPMPRRSFRAALTVHW